MKIKKDILKQYTDLKKEHQEISNKIKRLEKELNRMESEGTVSDTIKGGFGGKERFNVSGVNSKEYSRKKTLLLARKANLAMLEMELDETINDVEKFLSDISDSRIRRIIDLRFVQGLPWDIVAMKIGGNTKDSVRMAFDRFMKGLE